MKNDTLNIEFANQNFFEKIDELFACNVEKYIDFSQLIVVDDQSNDKNFVLKILTNFSFSRKSELCTRFAIQIIFRRSQNTRVSISMISVENATEKHKTICCF